MGTTSLSVGELACWFSWIWLPRYACSCAAKLKTFSVKILSFHFTTRLNQLSKQSDWNYARELANWATSWVFRFSITKCVIVAPKRDGKKNGCWKSLLNLVKKVVLRKYLSVALLLWIRRLTWPSRRLQASWISAGKTSSCFEHQILLIYLNEQ